MAQKLEPPVKPDYVGIDLTPGDPDSHFKVGHLMAAFENRDAAHEHLAYAAAKSSRNSQYLFEAGFNLLQAGHYDKAERYLKRAIKFDPEAPFYRYAYGETLSALGRPKEAIEHFEKAVSRDPNCERFKSALERVRPAPT